MLLSRRYLTLAALAVLLLGSQANAFQNVLQRPFFQGPFFQRPFFQRPFAMPQINTAPIAAGLRQQQLAYNTAVLGQAALQTPPFMTGYNPVPPVIYSAGPTIAVDPALSSPYALSTAPSYNPYLGGMGSLGSSPYSLSTTGGGGGYGAMMYGTPNNPYSNYYNPNYGGYSPLGSALQGAAALASSAGTYHLTIQKARIAREQARQMALDTTRRRIELERWYESMRPTHQQVRDKEVAAELEHVRKDASDVEVNSAKALNVLLRSIQKSTSQVNRGPNVPLDEDTLKHINLSGGGVAGNVGMLKDVTKLNWPEALQAANYDEARKNLNQNLSSVVLSLKDKDPVPVAKLKDIRADYKTLNDRLNEAADEMSPSEYIESRRFLNQLNQAIRALADPNVGKFFTNSWTAKGKTVAELVSNMSKDGLTFAPAAPGDQAAYKSLYLSMREFETGLETARR